MVNEIKMDLIDSKNNMITAKQNQAKEPLAKQFAANPNTKDDAVNVHISTFNDWVVADNSADEAVRVQEMKRQMNSGDYKVNMDELAKKLYRHIFPTNRAIG